MTAYTGQEQIEKRIRKLLQGDLLNFGRIRGSRV